MLDRSALVSVLESCYGFARENMDLTDCFYGASHGSGDFVDHPLDYYYFLAGFVCQVRCSRLLELGTHFGGSIRSMARGLEHAGIASTAEVVTVDVRRRNEEAFARYPMIRRVQGNCCNDALASGIAENFGGPLDVLFVDTIHTYEITKRCLELYIPLLSPRFVFLDDICLNPSMAQLWADLTDRYEDRAFDVTKLACREPNVGFGLLWNPDAPASLS